MNNSKVAFVEPIGGHRGNEFYDFGLCKAVNDAGIELSFYTCDETHLDEQFPFSFKTIKTFNRVYGKELKIIRGVRYVLAIRKTLQDAKAKGYNVLHANIYHFSRLELLILRMFKNNGFKIVTTIHDVEDFQKYGTTVNSDKYLKFEKLIDRIIVHSDFAKQSVEKYFSKTIPSHIHKVPHGDTDFLYAANCSVTEAREKLKLPTNKQLILFFGQIKKVKGLDVLLKAFAQLRKQNSEVQLVVAGPTWKVEETEFLNIIRENNMEGDCIMRLEYISNEMIPYYFRASDIVALPYRKIYSSGVLIRSLDYGAAIVASDLDVFKDIIADGQNGILFQTENPDDLSIKMQNLLANKQLQEKLKAGAKQTANEKFSWKLIGEKVKAIYSLALNE